MYNYHCNLLIKHLNLKKYLTVEALAVDEVEWLNSRSGRYIHGSESLEFIG
jgi:hypothetical protein